MALARTRTVALVGIDGHAVEVEADLAPGLPGCTLIGLPDAALHEARDRVRAAIANSRERWPQQRITIGLSPASLPKGGSAFDLAMAVAILAAAGTVPIASLHDLVLFGELGLDGRVRPVRGVLPAVLAASRAGFVRAAVPAANAEEARLVPDIDVLPVATLSALLARLRGAASGLVEEECPAEPSVRSLARQLEPEPDLADVVGQLAARRAVEVAAAGGHHLFLVGPPGAGKTMLAERLPGLLPDLDRTAALEVTAIHSVAGQLPPGAGLVTRPPFCHPHHTATTAALVGGGSGLARPGAASLAHRGVLFLDEAPEFQAGALDALRQPLESGEIILARAAGTTRYPARFALVLAANPCPCGLGRADGSVCTCSPSARRRYLTKLSGPLLDRVDLRCQVQPVSRAALLADRELTEPSSLVRERVAEAGCRARRRLAGTPWRANAEVPGRELRTRWPLPGGAWAPLQADLAAGRLSARGLDRVLRVAWTLADLAGIASPGWREIGEARGLRMPVGVVA
ncbi:MAG TPA: YifB family Mg chelatase-like AAA ATPase [Mycobacteriales bacterium]|nr:YifB family Mg chelatase-like AAA ATPase [Mycobacteriales bacterium]